MSVLWRKQPNFKLHCSVCNKKKDVIGILLYINNEWIAGLICEGCYISNPEIDAEGGFEYV